MFEVIAAFAFGEQVESLAAQLPQFVGGALGAVAQQLFELAEGQLDRVEVGRIRTARRITSAFVHIQAQAAGAV